METLTCNNNDLTILDVSDCSRMDYIECINNKLIDIVATGCTRLYDVSCEKNRITKEITGVWTGLGLFDYARRYTGYWKDGNGDWHYTDNGVGWWWPGEPHDGPHRSHYDYSNFF